MLPRSIKCGVFRGFPDANALNPDHARTTDDLGPSSVDRVVSSISLNVSLFQLGPYQDDYAILESKTITCCCNPSKMISTLMRSIDLKTQCRGVGRTSGGLVVMCPEEWMMG